MTRKRSLQLDYKRRKRRKTNKIAEDPQSVKADVSRQLDSLFEWKAVFQDAKDPLVVVKCMLFQAENKHQFDRWLEMQLQRYLSKHTINTTELSILTGVIKEYGKLPSIERCFEKKKEYIDSEAWSNEFRYQLAGAYQGDMACQNDVGYCYKYGSGVEKDEKRAIYWYQMASDRGDVLASQNLARSYLYGVGVEQNDKKYLQYLKRACKQDPSNTDNTRSLADCYYKGIGTTQDVEKAMEMYEDAANQLNTTAMINLAQHHENNGNLDEAVEWYEMAANADLPGAQEVADRCTDFISSRAMSQPSLLPPPVPAAASESDG